MRTVLLLLCALLAACAGSSPRPSDPGSDPGPAPAPAPDYRLDFIERIPKGDLSFLTGANKQAALELRYRQQIAPGTPAFVPRTRDGLDLFIADPVAEGWLAFYRGRCGDLGDVCAFRAALYGDDGGVRWDLDLNRFLQRDRYVEIQDVRLHKGRLYFNEACATYARDADGQCSSLVRVDPERAVVDWRTPPLTSNDVFILHDPYVIAGYGFTSEPDSLFLVRQADGRIVQRVGIDSAHDYLEVRGDHLYAVTYNSLNTFAIRESN